MSTARGIQRRILALGAAAALAIPLTAFTGVLAMPDAARAAPAAQAARSASVHAADSDDFTFASDDVDFTLTRADNGQAELITQETLVADFPSSDQNHGIIREIPRFNGATPLDVKLLSVTDGAGDKLKYSTDDDEDENGDSVLSVKIGDANHYVHGAQTYVLRYRSSGVIRYYSDTDDQEFYWDVNGDGWPQTFGSVTGTLHVDGSIAAAYNGQAACYRPLSDDKKCEVDASPTALTVAMSQKNLPPFSTLTMAVGFTPGTFAAPLGATAHLWVRILTGLIALAAAVCIAFTVWLRVARYRHAPGTGVIVPQYEPPAGLGMLEAAALLNRTKAGVPALITRLVVAKAVTMFPPGQSPLGAKAGKDYVLRLEQLTALDAEDQSAASAFFPTLQASAVTRLDRRNRKIGDRLVKRAAAAKSELVSDKLLQLAQAPGHGWIMLLGLVVAIGAIALGIWGADENAWQTAWFAIVMGCSIPLGIATLILAAAPNVRTAAGAATVEQLEGLKLFIKVAEEERLRVLQSPSGAQKIDTGNGTQMVQLYESLLPWAVLWGLAEEWQKVLGERFATTPDYASGIRPIWIGMSFSHFATSYSSSSFTRTSSSGRGGSGGGGFSGGGGGGGGGGGW